MWDFIVKWFLNDFLHINEIGSPLGTYHFVISILSLVFVVLFAYRFVFTIIGFFHKKVTFPVSEKKHKIAALICARNEENVIETGINSVRYQDYPQELIDIFVVADNCSDHTADVARSKGCIVVERNEPDKARKGWGMEYFFKKIIEDGSIHNYDAFIVLDADCIISKDFFSKMNDAYSTGKFEAVVGYPDTVNFNDNVVTSAYGYNYYRMVMSCHRPKAVLHVGDGGCGTGWLVSKELILKEGWDSHTLTEDAEYVTKMVTKGYKFGFCEDAKVYIEHPTNFFISCRQRIRCAKGSLINFCQNWFKLVWSFIKRPSMTKYDNICEILPYALVNIILTLVYQVWLVIDVLLGGDPQVAVMSFLSYIGFTVGGICVGSWFLAILITIREWKSINAPVYKVIFYIIIFPWFDIMAIPCAFLSLFMHVKWKKIPHKSTKDNKTLEDELRSLNK